MLDVNEKCHFSEMGICGALDMDCAGFREGCKFRKTTEQYHEERDKSIDRCRELGLCNSCKYKMNCVKSDEPKPEKKRR